MGTTFEFDVTVLVRKRVQVAGPMNAEEAEKVLQSCIRDMGFHSFAKREGDQFSNWPIETIVGNDMVFELVEQEPL